MNNQSLRSRRAKTARFDRRRRLRCEMLEDRRLLAAMVDGSETLVNSFTTGFQNTRAETQSIAGNSAGEFAVAWDGRGPDGSQEIYMQRFDSSSTPVGSQTLVNVTTSSNQRYASVAMGTGGETVVAWSGKGAGDTAGVFTRLYDNTGTPVSGEIRVNQTTSSNQEKPVIAKSPADDSFIVSWSGRGVGDTVGVFARRYAGNGIPLTGEFLVNTTTTSNQSRPAIDIASDGSFIVSWSGTGPGDVSGVFFQRYNSAGVPQGSETRANTTITGGQNFSSVGIDGANNFIVAWSGAGAGDTQGVFSQRYNASGSPVGGETLVNTNTLYAQEHPSVAVAPSGTAVITWTSLYQDGSQRGVYLQEYDPSGTPVGSETLVNTTTSSNQQFSSVAQRGEFRFTVGWSGRGVGDTSGVFSQSYRRNQPPTANDDQRTVIEDNPPYVGNGDVTANDFDPDFDPLTVTEVNGSFSNVGVLQNGTYSSATINATGLYSYTVNNASPAVQGLGPGQVVSDSYAYTIDDGNGGTDSAALIINVEGINDAPSFTAGADESVLEDAGAQSVTNWATAIDDGDSAVTQSLTFNITGNTNPSLFSAGPEVDPSGTLTYTPADDANGVAVITLELQDDGGTANGGIDTSPPQQFTISVTAVNDAPSFTVGADETVLEDAGPQSVPGWATGISAGPPDEAGQTLTFNITGNTNPSLFSSGPSVNSAGDLSYTPADDANGSAVITLELQDNGGTANGGVDTSPPQQFTISVTPVNDAPSFTVGADESVLEDAGPQSVPGWATGISPGPPDESGQSLTFNITGNTNASLFSAGPAVNSAGDLTYTPADDANGVAVITLELQDDGGTANGGVDTSPPQQFTISVTAVNDAPSFTVGADETVLEDAGPQSVPGWATGISAGPPDEAGQTLTFNIIGNTNASLFSSGPSVNAAGDLSYTPADDANGSAVITLNLQDNGGTANGGVDTSPSQQFTISVTAVNDAPSFTKGPDQVVQDTDGAQTVNPWATGISPGPPDEAGQSLTFNITGNTDMSLFSTQPSVDSSGVLTYTPQVGANGTSTITLDLMDDGGTANGGVDTSPSQSFTIQVIGVQPPTAVDDAYSALGNVSLTVPVLDGVILGAGADNNGGGAISVTAVQGVGANVGVATDTNAVGLGGVKGSVTLFGNGNFTYEPPPGYVGNDTFTYEITNVAGSDTATVTIAMSDMIWFIDNASGGSNKGTQANPFTSIGSFNSAQGAAAPNAKPGDSIFVDTGNASYTTGINLQNNQILIGKAAGATIESITGLTPPSFSDPLPTTGGTAPILTDTGAGANAIDLGTNNTVRGLDIGNTGGTGIDGSQVGTLFVREVGISGTGGGVDLRSTTAASIDVVLDSLSASSSTDEGIKLNNVSGTFNVTGTTGTISNTNVPAIDITGAADPNEVNLGTLTFSTVSANGGNTGINLTNTLGSLTVGTANISNISQTTADTFNSTDGRPTSLGNGNGIQLVNSQGFTANGGTIQDIADNALDIRDSHNTSLNNVTISDGSDGNTWSTGNSTIQWYLGSNLSLNTVNISNIGDNTVQTTGGINIQDSGIRAYDVSGDLDIIDSIFDTATGYVFDNASLGSEDRAVELDNDTGTSMDVTVKGSTFKKFDFQGLNLRHTGGDLDAIIGGPNASDKNTFENINGAAVDTGPSAAASSGNLHGLIVENNQFTTVGIGVSVFSGRGTAIGGVEGTHAFIKDNTINGTTSDAIRLLGFGSGSLGNNAIFRASVTGNTITGVADQLNNKGGGYAFFVAAEDNADSDVTIDSNPTVTGGTSAPNNFAGGIGTQNQRNGDLDLILTNNNFNNFNTGAANGFGVAFFGNDSNTASANTETSVRVGGNNWNSQFGGFGDTFFFDAFGNQMDVEGYAGGPTDSAALVTYLNTQDSNVAGPLFTIFTGPVTGGAASVTPPNSVPTTPLMAADGQGAGAAAIDSAQLTAIVDSAISQLIASGLTAAQQAALNNVTVSLVDLSDGMLGQTSGTDHVMIDIDGAGWGWFVDATPLDSTEFGADGVADASSDAYGKVDLLTVVMHELGHVLGQGHDDGGVMSESLAKSTREDLDAFFASLD